MIQTYAPEPGIAGHYIDASHDETGNLLGIRFHDTENFNFAYDVIDVIARETPEKVAIIWTDDSKQTLTFTFAQLSRMSNAVANYLVSRGLKKGDTLEVQSSPDTTEKFEIKGFTEDPIYGSTLLASEHFFISGEDYDRIEKGIADGTVNSNYIFKCNSCFFDVVF